MHSLANTEDEELFTQIVEKLCSLAALEEMEETIDDLEKALKSSPHCKNTPFFSVVKGEIMDIDFYFQPIVYLLISDIVQNIMMGIVPLIQFCFGMVR